MRSFNKYASFDMKKALKEIKYDLNHYTDWCTGVALLKYGTLKHPDFAFSIKNHKKEWADRIRRRLEFILDGLDKAYRIEAQLEVDRLNKLKESNG